MLARRVQRCSLVDGGSSPGTMNGPMVPPSNRIVSCGACRRCASVAASRGTPTPANPICPSLSSRPAFPASSSEAVHGAALRPASVIVDTPPAAARIDQLLHAEQLEVGRPRLGRVVVFCQVVA